MGKNIYAILIAVILCIGISGKVHAGRDLATGLNGTEEFIKVSLESFVKRLSRSKKAYVVVSNSTRAVEYSVYFKAEDNESFNLLSGLRLRTMKIMYNELYLEAQKQENDYKLPRNPKKILIHFYGEDD